MKYTHFIIARDKGNPQKINIEFRGREMARGIYWAREGLFRELFTVKGGVVEVKNGEPLQVWKTKEAFLGTLSEAYPEALFENAL